MRFWFITVSRPSIARTWGTIRWEREPVPLTDIGGSRRRDGCWCCGGKIWVGLIRQGQGMLFLLNGKYCRDL